MPARPSPRVAASRASSRAFTTIELMVALAIILVLLGIVVYGYRSVATGTQEKQTRTILERMRNMQGTIVSNKTANQGFFQKQLPFVYSYQINGSTPQVWDAVPAGSEDALAKTALILNALMTNPEAKKIFDELPTDRRRQMYFDTAQGGKVVPASSPTTLSAILPLDAWGNPICFVFDNWQDAVGTTASKLHLTTPAGTDTGGLTYLNSASAKGYWQPTNNQIVQQPTTYVKTAPTGYLQNLGTAYRSPDRQPFWASAGPDGSFQTHDDNVYSFDN